MKARTMQMTLIAAITVVFSTIAFAAPQPPEAQLYKFKFRMKSELYEYSQKTTSYEEAFERAAKSCYQHFKDGRKLTEDQGLDIIDVCANPRTI